MRQKDVTGQPERKTRRVKRESTKGESEDYRQCEEEKEQRGRRGRRGAWDWLSCSRGCGAGSQQRVAWPPAQGRSRPSLDLLPLPPPPAYLPPSLLLLLPSEPQQGTSRNSPLCVPLEGILVIHTHVRIVPSCSLGVPRTPVLGGVQQQWSRDPRREMGQRDEECDIQ